MPCGQIDSFQTKAKTYTPVLNTQTKNIPKIEKILNRPIQQS